ncbi:RHS repeat-associated core domain-containing protein [Pseudomonas sp. COR58]|uniref:RHS repeat-associated core domain-containing protein n=1 Tax=Pseudomonas ekonensis TaxID=2842353 RepID=A0ABS6P935_9PSED|nr:RHS repeat-associated core domain-containing protein [Pseudomonas ekonensis]MBV4456982.1 RHS repeat-associated core domain-containing protein [Pseudomonas ekonensis]
MTSSLHHHTPTLKCLDPRAQVIRQVDYLRVRVGDEVTALVSRHQLDVAGRLMAQWDPRLSRPGVATRYNLAGAPLKIDSVDAGWQVSLVGPAGEALQRWDARGNRRQSRYDGRLRVVTVGENATPDFETFVYGDAGADPGHNLRGQMIALKDASGLLEVHGVALTGQALHETRILRDKRAFVSRRRFGPSGTALEQTDAGGHRQRYAYDIAGQLKQVHLQLKDQDVWQTVLKQAHYNAAGETIEMLAGNGVTSRWSYDPANGRLHRQHTQNNVQPPLQDFGYEYDAQGNITRIVDHAFDPRFFANQRIDGQRLFTYDTLNRLRSATGHDDAPPTDTPGRPQPGNPADRRNYIQTYDYDRGGNLIALRHQRDGNTYTRRMFIDPASNRGVRWAEGDPQPAFDTLFDRAGNRQDLQPGQPLRWDSRNQLASVTFVQRDDGPDDVEHYLYSQGSRVCKRLQTHSVSASHCHEVLYLPGLEIRSKDNGERLHVIMLPAGVRCLHWEAGQPPGVEPDQLRYTLQDHLGSCLMELDRHAQRINHEGYYPFGATAWMTARSALETDYKTVRHSGQEMDASGLYYYGARYYAPWLQRWVSADPAGDVDGLNLYAFVGNNPIVHVDQTGHMKVVFSLAKDFLGILGKAKTSVEQLHNLATEFDGLVNEDADPEQARKDMTFGRFLKSAGGIKSTVYGAVKGAGVGGLIGTAVPGIGNLIGTVAGAVAGAVIFPLVRYYFLKKGLKLAQTLRTQELKAGLANVIDTTHGIVEGTRDLLNGGNALLKRVIDAKELIDAYPQALQKRLDEELSRFSVEQLSQYMELIGSGNEPFKAIDQLLKATNAPSAVESVTERLPGLGNTIIDPPVEKPIPKPRTRARRQSAQHANESYA